MDARQKGGTGLGLAICRSTVEQHGGDLGDERPGQGSTFSFVVPTADGAGAAATPHADARERIACCP